jgi:hypothetical protein
MPINKNKKSISTTDTDDVDSSLTTSSFVLSPFETLSSHGTGAISIDSLTTSSSTGTSLYPNGTSTGTGLYTNISDGTTDNKILVNTDGGYGWVTAGTGITSAEVGCGPWKFSFKDNGDLEVTYEVVGRKTEFHIDKDKILALLYKYSDILVEGK